MVRQVIKAGPDILFVALGGRAEELFIARHRGTWNVPVVIGVGGSLDVLAGLARRAPAWMRSLGLEWFYRLLREPRRFGGMLALPRFAALVLLDAVRRNLL